MTNDPKRLFCERERSEVNQSLALEAVRRAYTRTLDTLYAKEKEISVGLRDAKTEDETLKGHIAKLNNLSLEMKRLGYDPKPDEILHGFRGEVLEEQ